MLAVIWPKLNTRTCIIFWWFMLLIWFWTSLLQGLYRTSFWGPRYFIHHPLCVLGFLKYTSTFSFWHFSAGRKCSACKRYGTCSTWVYIFWLKWAICRHPTLIGGWYIHCTQIWVKKKKILISAVLV